MTTPEFQSELDGRATGTTVIGLRQPELMKCIIRCPEIQEQKVIAAILSSIDAKIIANEKVNDNLLWQAQALYKDRFIDLKPFNGKMPPDWQLGTVSEIIELHDSKRIPLSSRERANLTKIYPYYGATSVMDYVDRYLFDGAMIEVGWEDWMKDVPELQLARARISMKLQTIGFPESGDVQVPPNNRIQGRKSLKAEVSGSAEPDAEKSFKFWKRIFITGRKCLFPWG